MPSPEPPALPPDAAAARRRLETGDARGLLDLLDRLGGDAVAADPELGALHGECCCLVGRLDAAVASSTEALRLARERADPAAAARAASVLALSLARKGDARSLAHARDVLEPQLAGPPSPTGEPLGRLRHADGVLRLRLGELDAARTSLLRALAEFESAGEAWRAAAALDSLGGVHARMGDGVQAFRYYMMSLRRKRRLRDRIGEGITHGNLGRLLLQENAPERALREFDRNLALTRAAGDAYGEVMALNGRGLALLELHRLDDAVADVQEARRLAAARGLRKQEALCVVDLAIAEERRGRLDEGLRLSSEALAMFGDEGNLEGMGFSETVRGRILFVANRAEGARSALIDAVRILRRTHRHDLLADALVRLVEASIEPPDERVSAWLDEAEALARAHLLRGVLKQVSRLRPKTGGPVSSETLTIRDPLGLGHLEREYVLFDRIGSGTQGAAWKALDTDTAKLVVVKVVHVVDGAKPPRDGAPAPSPRARATVRETLVRRAVTEFEAAMRIDHPGVVRVFACERRAAEVLIAMEFLPGGNLRVRMAEGRASARDGWAWIEAIAAALEALHSVGVVHRDLNPNNVVFRGRNEPVLVDFGMSLLTKHVEDGKSSRTTIIGTPGYIAPEYRNPQFPFDHRLDLFALGALGVELLTGAHPLQRWLGSVQQCLEVLRQPDELRGAMKAVPRPGEIAAARWDALLRLAEPDPRDRFASARAFLAAVE